MTPTRTTSSRMQAGAKNTAGLAGIGAGTAIIALANSLPADNRLRPWLLYVAPALAVIAKQLWVWTKSLLDTLVLELKISISARRARARLRVVLERSCCSEEQKKRLQEQLADVDLLVASREIERLRDMARLK